MRRTEVAFSPHAEDATAAVADGYGLTVTVLENVLRRAVIRAVRTPEAAVPLRRRIAGYRTVLTLAVYPGEPETVVLLVSRAGGEGLTVRASRGHAQRLSGGWIRLWVVQEVR